MVVDKIKKGQQKQQRKERRLHLGRLADLVIQKRTLRRYEEAVTHMFVWFQRNGVDIANLGDMQTATFEWVEQCWEEGDPMSVAADGLSGIQHFLPELRGHLKGAWRMLGAWRLKEPPDRAPPMLPYIVQAMAGSAIKKGELMFAALLLVGFYLFLRTGELMLLRQQDIIFNGSGKSCVLNLGFTKSGKRRGLPEQVTLRIPWLIAFLRLVVSDLQPGDYLWGGKPSTFRKRFYEAVDEEGARELGFRPYSLRRGGATAAFQQGHSYDAVAEISRHQNLRTLKVYINDALAEALAIVVPTAVRHRTQRRAAALLALLG